MPQQIYVSLDLYVGPLQLAVGNFFFSLPTQSSGMLTHLQERRVSIGVKRRVPPKCVVQTTNCGVQNGKMRSPTFGILTVLHFKMMANS